MTKKNFLFKEVKIEKNDATQVELLVKEFNFPSKNNGEIKIEKIIIKGSEGDDREIKIENKSDLDTILNDIDDDDNFKLSFNEEEIKVKYQSNNNNLSMEASSSVAFTKKGTPTITIDEQKKSLSFEWNPAVIRFSKSETTDEDEENENDDNSPVSESTCQSKVDNINKKLISEGVTEGELVGEIKNSFEKLKNDEYTDENERNKAEKKVNKVIYEKSAEKKIADLTIRIDKAINENKEEDMKSLDKELDTFINNSNYQSKKVEAQTLSKRLKAKINQNSSSDGVKWYKDWKIMTPVVLVAFFAIIGLVVYFRRNNNNNTEIE